jgi:hypothetical protein
MQTKRSAAALMAAAGLLIAAPAFAQTPTPQKQQTQKQQTQYAPCGPTYNANPSGDSNCKQPTQSLTPSPAQGGAVAPK